MKILKKVSLFFFVIALSSCSGDDSGTVNDPDNQNPDPEIPEWAMTAVIDGQLHEMNNPWNSNFGTESIFGYYPNEEFIQLQGRWGGTFGLKEIIIWIDRDHLIPGTTYQVNQETNFNTTHIDLLDNTDGEYTTTYEGSITITDVDTNAKTVKGTFEFKTTADIGEDNPTTYNTVTDGTFDYRYDVEY